MTTIKQVFTASYRSKVRAALKSGSVSAFPTPATIGFGTGGWNPNTSTVNEPSETTTAMSSIYGIKSFSNSYDDGDYKILTSIIARNEWNGYGISQYGIFDASNDLIAIINTAEQIKMPGTQFAVRIKWGA